MKIIVLGAGVVGVSTAYYLAREGHQVTVIDKNSSCAMECSYANGGQLSYSHIKTWAQDLQFSSVLKSFFSHETNISLKNLDSKTLGWFYNFCKNSSNKKAIENSKKIYEIAILSSRLMDEILREESELSLRSLEAGIAFNYSKKGILHFYRNQKKFDSEIISVQKANFIGNRPLIMNASQCVEHEPNLIKLLDQKKLAGGILFSDDASGDAYKFTDVLVKICRQKYGVDFKFGVEVKNLLTNHQKITGINTLEGVFTADAYVYAMGYAGDKLLSGIKVNSKIQPIRGYSISTNCSQMFIAPTNSITDAENKIVYSRIGDIFRAAGIIEIGIRNKLDKNHLNFLRDQMVSSFANCGDVENLLQWSGIRPYRPNSIPLITHISRLQNLYLNTGHGSLGWTLALASGKILNDLILNKLPLSFEFLAHENTEFSA